VNALEIIRKSVEIHSQRQAYEDEKSSLTFEEVWQLAEGVAGHLASAGVGANERVALFLEDGSDALCGLIGIWLVGGIPIPINRSLNEEKIGFIVNQADPHWALVPAEGIGDRVPDSKQIKLESASACARADVAVPKLASDGDAMILYTSGTTGVPKGVLHSHHALALNAVEMSDFISLGPQDRLFLNIPFYYSNSISHLLMSLFKGSCICATFGFLFGDALLKKVAAFKATGFGGVPAHYVRIADAIEDGADTPELRFLMNSGDHLPINVLKTLLGAFPSSEFYCVYGISECAPRVCCLPPDKVTEKMGSVGRPLPSTEIEIIDENGAPARAGDIGEVYVRSACLMKEYFRAPEVTAESMTENGFKTGDLGYVDEDGDLFLTGRNDAVFKSGGEKVSCRLIEETLRDSELFRETLEDVVVLAIEDHFLGKVPCVYYVAKTDADFDQRAVRRYLSAKLPRSHVPSEFVALNEIQRSASGKVVKDALRDPANRVSAAAQG
jgi:acyl-CoA synthetase (AMP-forming)/AMP-acid ligase II